MILAALVTPATITDNMPMLDLARWVRFRWKVHPRIAVGDTKYGTIANIAELEQDGIRAYLPMRDYANDTPFFPPEQFRYDAEHDVYLCPQEQQLTRWTNKTEAQAVLYRADAAMCNAYPLKAQCTDSTSGKALRRSWFQEELDRVKGYWDTAAYARVHAQASGVGRTDVCGSQRMAPCVAISPSPAGEGQHRSPADRVWTESQALTQSTEAETSTLARRRG